MNITGINFRLHALVFLIGLSLLFSQGQVKAQYTNEFTVGEYVEFYGGDSIRIYFNCTGKICRMSCAEFYRTGIIDRERINVHGIFQDYYMNDTIAFKAVMDSGYIHGPATYYYPNGVTKSSGHYHRGKRAGIWKFYYETGNLMQVVNYVFGFPLITNYFSPNGAQKVVNGEGKYIGEYNTYRTCEPFEYKGKVTEGLLDGKVKIYNPMFRGNFGYEYYEKGKFVKGTSGNYNYEDAPKIELPGYNVHEQLLLDENTIYCPGFMGTSFMLYDKNMYWDFYSDLLDSIQSTIRYKVENQWLAVGIGVGFDDELFDVNVYSSINDYRFEKDLFNLMITMDKWESAQVFWRKINTNLFFTILITEGRILIPAEIMREQNMY